MRLTHWDSPRELGRLDGVSPRSAWPILGAHSAWACHAALRKVLEIGPHSSDFVVTFLFPRPHSRRPLLVFADTNQKNPRVHKIYVRNSGAGNGCANFMGTWKNCVLSAGKPMSIKFLVLGGVFWVFWGGGGADFILWARGFFWTKSLEFPNLVVSTLGSSKRHLPKGHPWILLEFHLSFRSFTGFIRKGRTWAIAVRRGSYKSLFLLNSGGFPLEFFFLNREIQFWTLVRVNRSKSLWPKLFPSNGILLEFS